MKTRLLVTTLAAVILTAGTTARAAEPNHRGQTEMTATCQHMDPESCRLMMREMVKRKDLHKCMAEELMLDPDFTQTWQDLHKHQSAHGG